MNETAQSPRQDRDGNPCPPWCRRNHGDGSSAASAHIRQTGSISFGAGGLDSLWAGVILVGWHGGRPAVGVTGHYYERPGAPYVEVPAGHADGLAGLVAMLAAATPEQHRELAAAIREAAAQVTEAGDGTITTTAQIISTPHLAGAGIFISEVTVAPAGWREEAEAGEFSADKEEDNG